MPRRTIAWLLWQGLAIIAGVAGGAALFDAVTT
jgi:hypothetical protein